MTWVTTGVGIGTAVLGAGSEKKMARRQASADELAGAYETERLQKQQIGRAQVDRVIDAPGRQQQYATFANALRGYLGDQLGKRKVDTSRNLKFSLARGGQTGGSVAVDANRELGQEFADATIANERSVQGSLADLKGQDEATRASLHSLVGNGLAVTDAGRRASMLTRTNLQNSDALARARGLGDVFSDTAATYKSLNERAALRRGFGSQQARTDLYGGRP